MKKYQVYLLLAASIAVFLLIYSPHLDYKLPYHIDEWHHITETIRLKQGDYPGGTIGYRVGFHLLLIIPSLFANLISIYQYLPALFGVISALVLFFITYKITNKNFFISLFAMIFFASLKSNTNITGLWFFTPLTLAIPLIYLYVYLLTQGLEKENKTFILTSLVIMLALIFIHPISLLFAIPFLIIFSLTKTKYLKKQKKFLSLFLLIPIIGIIFYSLMTKIPLTNTLGHLFSSLKFSQEWGVFIWDNSFFELYSLAGYLLAILGVAGIFLLKKTKKYLPYLLWPATLLIFISIYKITKVSYLVPYQRALYYLALSLPILSALGIYYLIFLINTNIRKIKIEQHKIKTIKKLVLIIISILIIFLAFRSYTVIPEPLRLYKVIDQNDYQAMLFLSAFPTSTIMSDPQTSVALFPITGHKPVATLSFYGDRRDPDIFFLSQDCTTRQEILNKHNVSYVLSKWELNCPWEIIYDQKDIIYKIK
jgi:hypothetical protein